MLADLVHERLLKETPPHKNLRMQVVDYDDYVNIRFFLDNFSTFSTGQQQDIAEWIGGVITRMRLSGLPVYLEAVEK